MKEGFIGFEKNVDDADNPLPAPAATAVAGRANPIIEDICYVESYWESFYSAGNVRIDALAPYLIRMSIVRSISVLNAANKYCDSKKFDFDDSVNRITYLF